MKRVLISAIVVGFSALSAGAAMAECKGSNGRGWGSGKGEGKYEMTSKDKVCLINFPNFIDDAAKTSIPATEVKLSRAPKNGTIGVTAQGLIYTPITGFKGADTFCTRNTTPKVRGKTLSGCVTVTVR